MDTHGADEPVSFDLHRTKYFEKQSKAQATKIIDLEAKVAYLEAKVEYLEGCLESSRVQAKSDMVFSSGPSRNEESMGMKRASSPEPPLFENLLPSFGVTLGSTRKKIRLEHNASAAVMDEDTDVIKTIREPSIEDLSALAPSLTEDYSRGAMLQDQNRNDSRSYTLSPTITQRVAGLLWFPVLRLAQHLQDVTVKRTDLNKKPLFVSSKVRFSRSGSGRNCIFLDTSHSPYCPTQYGEPGLLFSASKSPQWRMGLQSVFASSNQRSEHQAETYMYIGEYRLRYAPSLSVEEYTSLSYQTREEHASSILSSLGDKGLEEVRERLAPDFGKPYKSAVDGGIKRKTRAEALDDIYRAYERGNERINVWLMECMGFDEEFLRQIHEMKSPKASGKGRAAPSISKQGSMATSKHHKGKKSKGKK